MCSAIVAITERVQPFLFAKYGGDGVTAFVSVSRLFGTWHDPDFTNVDRMLFDASLSWRTLPFRIDLTAWRRASETTFPISPITIDTAYSAMVSWNVKPEVTLTALLRAIRCRNIWIRLFVRKR